MQTVVALILQTISKEACRPVISQPLQMLLFFLLPGAKNFTFIFKKHNLPRLLSYSSIPVGSQMLTVGEWRGWPPIVGPLNLKFRGASGSCNKMQQCAIPSAMPLLHSSLLCAPTAPQNPATFCTLWQLGTLGSHYWDVSGVSPT